MSNVVLERWAFYQSLVVLSLIIPFFTASRSWPIQKQKSHMDEPVELGTSSDLRIGTADKKAITIDYKLNQTAQGSLDVKQRGVVRLKGKLDNGFEACISEHVGYSEGAEARWICQ